MGREGWGGRGEGVGGGESRGRERRGYLGGRVGEQCCNNIDTACELFINKHPHRMENAYLLIDIIK